jgi:membrane-bound lytic murein transglycosylase B
MQFMPSTWAEYGRGNVHDPRAAILAAARFLRAAGAPGSERTALLRYNPSSLYVDAVERYAGRIRRNPASLVVFYVRSPLVR